MWIIGNNVYRFQIDKNAVPVFYINKNCWNYDYKQLIRQFIHDYNWAYLLCEPVDKTKPHMEVTCTCLRVFEEFIETVENYIK